LIQEFGDNATDVFEQMTKGNWEDDLGHKVSMNDAMCKLGITVVKVLTIRRKKNKITLDLTMHHEQDPETGMFAVRCLEIPEAISQGRTLESAEENLKDAIRMVMKDKGANDEPRT